MSQIVSDDEILDLFTPDGHSEAICVGCFSPGVAIHEIVPRSRTNDWDEPDNRVTLCQACHSEIHHKGTVQASAFLRAQRLLILDMFGHRNQSIALERKWFESKTAP